MLAARAVTIAIAIAIAAPARSQSSPSLDVTLAAEADALDRAHEAHARLDRHLNTALLIGGLISVAAGAALLVPDADHQAWRFAGAATLTFGAIDALLAGLALPSSAASRRAWQTGAAARRTPAGLARARRAVAGETERLGLLYAVNLGLDFAYAGASAFAVGISRLPAGDSERWLAVGVAGLVQSAFLIAIDTVGLLGAHRAFGRAEGSVTPTLSAVPGGGVAAGLAGSF